LRRIRRKLLGLVEGSFAFLDPPLPGQIACQVQQAAHLPRRHFDGPAELFFGGVELPSPLRQLSLREMPCGRIPLGDPFRDRFRFVIAASQKAGRLQIIIEQIVQRFLIPGIQRDGLLEIGPCLSGVLG
jgi:hypothetical protein